MILQGDVYWVDLGEPAGSEPGYRRPVVVLTSDAFNASRMRTVLVCPLTSNTRLASIPGNVLIRADEAGLPRDSVATAAGIEPINKSLLDELAGRLPAARVRAIIAALIHLLEQAAAP